MPPKIERQTGVKDLPTGEQLVSSEDGILNRRRIEIPRPPQDLLEKQALLLEKGVTVYEAHFLPSISIDDDARIVKPNPWFYQNIKEKRISEDALKLPGMWVLIDGSPKPNYNRGLQMYANDPHAPTLARLREEGKIAIPDHTKQVPKTSRFGVSFDEIDSHVAPEEAKRLFETDRRVRVPTEAESVFIGSLYHPELGETNTWEWRYDKVEDGRRLLGGRSGNGGLAYVDDSWPGHHDVSIGFRLLVEFPQK